MAQGTTSTPGHTPRMAATPGVGAAPPTAGTMQPMAGQVAQTPETKGAEPKLSDGIDPVLLHRLHPDADSAADAGARALAQGKKTWAEGAETVAAQQVPVVPLP